MGRGRARGGHGSLARVVPEFGRASQSRAGWQTQRAAGDVREEVGTLGSGSASHVDGLTLPLLTLITPFLDLTAECRTPFREPLQFIVIAVMSVMSGAFPDTYGVST